MGMTLEYFLMKRITILKEMLERLPDDSEFNKGVRSAYKDELFVCESILAKDKTESEATITIDEVTNTIDIKELRNKIETDICDTFDRYKPVINQDKRSQIVHKVKEHVLEIIDDTISVTSKAFITSRVT